MGQTALSSSWHPLKESLRKQAFNEGFSVAGFAPPAPPPHADGLRPWLQQQSQGEMAWLAQDPERRMDPRQLLDNLGTVLVLGVNVCPADDPLAAGRDPGRGWIAAHARHRDYHDILKKRLKRLSIWLDRQMGQPVAKRLLVDTAPILEKPLAVAAGLGWQGKNSLLVSPRFGCWLLLAEILLPFPLPPDAPLPDRCGTCRRCLVACPTDALAQPYRLNARRCLAYLTIEHAGPIPLADRVAMGNRIYGCDSCLVACPWNRFAPATQEADWQPRPLLMAPPLLDCVDLDEAGFRTRMAQTPIRRIGLIRFLRNVAIALGNGGTPEALAALARLLHHAAPLVRGHAAWGIGQWASQHRGDPLDGRADQMLDDRAQIEEDPWVREEIGMARYRMAGGAPPG